MPSHPPGDIARILCRGIGDLCCCAFLFSPFFLNLWIYTSTWTSIEVYPCTCAFMHFKSDLSIYLYLSIYLSVCLSIYLSIYIHSMYTYYTYTFSKNGLPKMMHSCTYAPTILPILPPAYPKMSILKTRQPFSLNLGCWLTFPPRVCDLPTSYPLGVTYLPSP